MAVFAGEAEPPASEVDRFFARVRRAAVLDLLEQALRTPGLDAVVLCSDDRDMLQEAARIGALVRATARPFHFGGELLGVVRDLRPETLVVMGGASGPLITADDLERWLELIGGYRHAFAVNNPLSPDVVLVRPAAAVLAVDPPGSDNELGVALRRLGLTRVLLPNEARINLDLDTPTDALMLSLVPVPGARLRAVLRDLPWRAAAARLRGALQALSAPGGEVFLAGRVSPVLVGFLNARLPVRTRVLAEERGMKALGREVRGEVFSFLAEWMESAGLDGFFRALERACTAAFIDTRPLLAHRGRRVAQRDRFLSDVGEWRSIADPWLRALTRRSVEAGIPVVLGGHNVVYGGLWYLAELLAAQRLDPGALLEREESVAGTPNA